MTGSTPRTLLCLFAFLPGACGTVPAPAPAVPSSKPIEPPVALVHPSNGGVRFYGSADKSLSLRASYETQKQLVRVAAIHTSAGRDLTRQDDEYHVRYWPTCMLGLDGLRLCVAGENPLTGRAVIEVWTFSQPVFESARNPGSPGLLTGGVVTSIDEIYDGVEDGRVLVDDMLLVGAQTSGRALLHFRDSGEVCSLDFESRALNLVASPEEKPGAFMIPALANASFTGAGRLSTGEWACTLRVPVEAQDGQPNPNEARVVLLWDRDHDGEVESFETISDAEFARRGYSAPGAWKH
jgi:hypothetical protein